MGLKRKFSGILILVLLFSLACSSYISAYSPDVPEKETIDIVEKYIAFSAENDHVKAVDLWYLNVLSVADNKNLWDMLVLSFGAYESVENIKVTPTSEYIGVELILSHKTSDVLCNLALIDNKIVGFSLVGVVRKQMDESEASGFVEYDVVVGEGTKYPLNGKLSMPLDNTKPVPVVILVHGSGPNDMDETIFSNKPFRDIAHYLASNGIAVLRYEKRTFAYLYAPELYTSTFTVNEEYIEDVIHALDLVSSVPGIDYNNIFIAGHSLGGMLAPRILGEEPRFKGAIVLAGSLRQLYEIQYDQNMNSINSDAYKETYKENYIEQRKSDIALVERELKLAESLSDMTYEESMELTVFGIPGYYVKDMVDNASIDYFKKEARPFLVLQGTKDFQVSLEKDFALFEKTSKDMSNVTLKSYEGLSHLFMKSINEPPSIYDYMPESHVDETVLEDIVLWIHYVCGY